ncbi:hypothetical protein D3C71_1459420 [compost metagenome]
MAICSCDRAHGLGLGLGLDGGLVGLTTRLFAQSQAWSVEATFSALEATRNGDDVALGFQFKTVLQ